MNATQPTAPGSPWRTVAEGAARAKVGSRVIYAAIARNELRAARVGKRIIRLRDEWIDRWVEASAPKEIPR